MRASIVSITELVASPPPTAEALPRLYSLHPPPCALPFLPLELCHGSSPLHPPLCLALLAAGALPWLITFAPTSLCIALLAAGALLWLITFVRTSLCTALLAAGALPWLITFAPTSLRCRREEYGAERGTRVVWLQRGPGEAAYPCGLRTLCMWGAAAAGAR